MIQISNQENCCGCTACASICPHGAITMKEDNFGFIYPHVNTELCTNCGLCEKVCAFHADYDKSMNLSGPLIYAARHKSMQEIETSRSGGAFIAISDYILDMGGIVYGAGYSDHFRVVHKRAVTKEERNEFKGSKYVQSDLRNIFPLIKKDLKNGCWVLFSGTPCQTAGLASYIGKRLSEKLVLVDIVCHGVPAPFVWRDYINYIEKKYKQQIIQVNFRDKSKIGWSGHVESFILKNNKIISPNIYRNIFFKDIMLRPSCYKCHYTNTHRPSDFTLGDYWGWERISSTFNKDNKGCSLLFINTDKAKTLFNDIKKDLEIIPADIKNCLQPNLIQPTEYLPEYEIFRKQYQEKGFKYIAKKYGIPTYKEHLQNVKGKIKHLIKKSIYKIIKKKY